MPPDVRQDDSDLCPTRTNPRMPQLFMPVQQENALNNPQEAEENDPLENDHAAQRRRNRLPFLIRLFLGSQIARYLRMRREANGQQQQEREPLEEEQEGEHLNTRDHNETEQHGGLRQN